MLNKTDCMSILIKLEDAGLNIDPYIKKLAMSSVVPAEVLKFIADNQGLELVKFFEHIRKNYNQKKSPLYINLINLNDNSEQILTTLSSLLNQILLYASKISDEADRLRFIKEARASEITKVLQEYFNNFSILRCQKLLKLIKSDLLVLEYISGRREAE